MCLLRRAKEEDRCCNMCNSLGTLRLDFCNRSTAQPATTCNHCCSVFFGLLVERLERSAVGTLTTTLIWVGVVVVVVTLCRDSIPRYDGVKKSHLETVAPEMVNTCIRLALSRSQRRKVDANGGIDVGGDIGVIWDVASLGFR